MKGDKIKRDTMISDYEQGGLKMVDVKIFSKALKATWIKKYLDQNNHAKWKLVFDLQLQDLGGATFFRGNLNQKDVLKVGKVSDVFLQEILQIWSGVTFEDCMSSVTQLRSQPLWFNSLVRVENKPMYYALWATKGIQVVSDLMVNESTLFIFLRI